MQVATSRAGPPGFQTFPDLSDLKWVSPPISVTFRVKLRSLQNSQSTFGTTSTATAQSSLHLSPLLPRPSPPGADGSLPALALSPSQVL